MKNFQSDIKIDVRELIAPISLLRVEKKLSGMASGQIAEVLCVDEETKADLIDIVRNSKHRCLAVEETEDCLKLYIEKGV
jgi:TusA-related sulfurtransferase